MLCSLLDWLRILLFRFFKVDERIKVIDHIIGEFQEHDS